MKKKPEIDKLEMIYKLGFCKADLIELGMLESDKKRRELAKRNTKKKP